MRKIFFVIFIMTICAITGCQNNQMYDLNDINMRIKEGTLTNHSATIIIVDNSKKNNTYGEWFRIDKKENGKWKKLKIINDSFFNSIAYKIDENNELELEHNWESIYGKLSSGNYRLIKEVNNNKYISVDFTID